MSWQSFTSPDWHGTGWYRFVLPLGTKLARSDPSWNHCGTAAAGYMKSRTLPKQNYTTLDIDIAFNATPWLTVRGYKTTGKVTNCAGYYVYYLRNTICNFRYCGE